MPLHRNGEELVTATVLTPGLFGPTDQRNVNATNRKQRECVRERRGDERGKSYRRRRPGRDENAQSPRIQCAWTPPRAHVDSRRAHVRLAGDAG